MTPIAAGNGKIYFKSPAGGLASLPVPWVSGTLYTLLASSGNPYVDQIVVDSSNVYWLDGSNNVVVETSLTSSQSQNLAPLQSSPYGIAIDSTTVYWTNNSPGQISRIPIALPPGTVTTLSLPNGAAGVAVDSTSIYFASGGEVDKMAKNSTTFTRIAWGTPSQIAVDANYVYWLDYAAKAVMRTTK
jgi:hypothetical protein